VSRGKGRVRIGTSGYQYRHWKGVFYPEGLPQRGWFGHYARRFDTVEINNTFYRLPAPEVFDAWRKQAPSGFRYAIKFSRFGTHVKRLRDPQAVVDLFVERARRLEETLGPILVQLPPRWGVNAGRLAAFLEALPGDVRWSLEFRDPSWLCEEVFDLLQEHNCALCQHDMIARHPRRVTADWVYLRYHGDHYRGSYTHQYLTAQARRIREYVSEGLDVYAYFNNDERGYAVFNAEELRRYLGAD
jgi:uncharacterized protein YecE (DUF72 family)